jgi:hypothetical protein
VPSWNHACSVALTALAVAGVAMACTASDPIRVHLGMSG